MIARAVAFVALASLVVACGASTTSSGGGDGGGGSGSGSGSSGGSSSGGGPGSGPCPATEPSTALSDPTPCALSLEGVSCEYGDDPDMACNTVVICTPASTQQGVWGGAGNAAAQTCPTPPATGACPASYAAAQSAGACTQSGLACGYPQGRCECARATGGPPIVGGMATRWLCDDAPSGCPSPRPHVGAACSASGPQSCNYGACTIPDGVTLACTNGTWQSTPTACAE